VVRTVEWKKILMITGIGILVYAGIRYLLPAAIPFLLGWFLASLILPAAKWMEKKWHIRRGIAGGILMGILTVAIAFLLWRLSGLLLEQVKRLFENVGLWIKQADGFLDSCCRSVSDYVGIDAQQMRKFLVLQAGILQERVQNQFGQACVGYLFTMLKGVVALCGGVLVVIIFGTLVIKDMEEFREKMRAGAIGRKFMAVAGRICMMGGKYLKAQFMLMGIVSLICMVGFWLLDNPYFVAVGLTVGFLDALPLIGTGMILIPWSILWCIQGEYMTAVGYFILYLVADLVRQFLEPRLLGREMGMHPALMLIAVYGGFLIYGFSGFFLGPITYLIVKTVWEEISEEKNCGENREKSDRKTDERKNK
jgi:sporulation integral membrane protein YtvI